jgi:hypothetical protein
VRVGVKDLLVTGLTLRIARIVLTELPTGLSVLEAAVLRWTETICSCRGAEALIVSLLRGVLGRLLTVIWWLLTVLALGRLIALLRRIISLLRRVTLAVARLLIALIVALLAVLIVWT